MAVYKCSLKHFFKKLIPAHPFITFGNWNKNTSKRASAKIDQRKMSGLRHYRQCGGTLSVYAVSRIVYDYSSPPPPPPPLNRASVTHHN